MITSIKFESPANTNFRARTKINKSRIPGNIRYSAAKSVSSLQSAVRDIINNLSGNGISPKVQEVMDKYNVKFDDCKKILSLAGLGGVISLLPSVNKNNKEVLGINIAKKNSEEKLFQIDENRVYFEKGNESKYLTQQEIDESHFEEIINNISNEVDFPLLKIRQAQCPEHVPYVPVYTTEKAVPSKPEVKIEEKTEKLKEENLEKAEETVFVLPKSIVDSRKIHKESAIEKFNTTDEVDLMLRSLFGKKEVKTTKLVDTNPILSGRGKISEKSQELLKEVLDLLNRIDELNAQKNYATTMRLYKHIPTFSSYRRGANITLKNIGEDNGGLSLVRTHSKKHKGGNIVAIYKRNKEGDIIDIIPICNDRVYRMQKSFNLSKADKFVNFISVSKCLSQSEIDSKDIETLLSTIKNELYEIINVLDPRVGEISNAVKEKLASVEKKLSIVREKEKKAQGFDDYPYLSSKTGSLYFRKFNPKDESMMFISSFDTVRVPGSTIIKIGDKYGNNKIGWMIKDGKVVKNYNPKINYYPKDLRYYNELELKNLGFEKEVLECLQYIEEKLDITSKIMDSYRASKIFSKKYSFI